MVAAPVASPVPRSVAGGRPGRRLIRRWRVFGPGRWKGETYTRADIAELVANYHRFKQPLTSPDPFWIPNASIHHDDGTVGLCDGEVVDAGQDADGWLWVSILIDPTVATAMDAGKLKAASVEWWNTRNRADRELSGFPLTPDGKPVGRVLCRVSLMGAMPPAVKGQPRPPKSEPAPNEWLQKFNDSFPRERVTVEIPTMQDQLAALGLTPEQITGVMALMGSGGGVAPPPTEQMGDPAATADGDADNMKQLFSDAIAKVTAQGAALKAELDALKAEKAAAEKQAAADLVAKCKLAREQFSDAMVKAKKLPAERDRILADLEKLDPAVQISALDAVGKSLGLGAAAPKADRQFSAPPEGAAANPLVAAIARPGSTLAKLRPEYAARLRGDAANN